MLNNYIRKFHYDKWANERACDSIATLDPDTPQYRQATGFLAHLLEASNIWRSRILEEDIQGRSAWNTRALEESRTMIASEAAAWRSFLESRGEAGLNDTIRYTSLKGEPFEHQIGDMLDHLINHGTYHRGQIALVVREGGGKASPTDYIVYLRQKLDVAA